MPGGDPGHTQPKYLLALLEKQTASLHKYHPKAKMWVSPQSLSKEWIDEFYEPHEGRTEVADRSGLRSADARQLPELRKRVPTRYPVRNYPDITHSINSQYSVPDWDLAYMVTEAREVGEPSSRSTSARFSKQIRITRRVSDVLGGRQRRRQQVRLERSRLGSRTRTSRESLREFGRYFIGEDVGDTFAAGILALERNWKGPLLANEGVETTCQQFREMEKRATPQIKLNWRFQQALYRAYYDAYVRHRLIHETALEQQAHGCVRGRPP